MEARAYAAASPSAPLEPTTIERRELRPKDVAIEIKYSGICHSDIHQAREEWFTSIFPMVPGHEIAGIVTAVGPEVSKFAVGDRVGVGVFVEACGECDNCQKNLGNYCKKIFVPTYNGRFYDGTPTYGGYSSDIVVDEDYVLNIPDGIELDEAAPLLCAGITTYSPLKEWGAGPGKRVAVMGLGGLGHMGVKHAHAMGADVTLISHSPGKKDDALRLGADHFLLMSDEDAMEKAKNSFDIILNTVSAPIDMDKMLGLLDTDGTMICVGLPDEPIKVSTFSLAEQRRRLAGSNIGGIGQTQEMLDFCAAHGYGSDVEVIPAEKINEAWERVVNSDVRYRFVIDASTF
ncbi:MAG: hypothetical protein RJB01_1043 [Actinomycetota bacterium]